MKKCDISIKKLADFFFSILSHIVFTLLIFSLLMNLLQLMCLAIFHNYTQNTILLISLFVFTVIFSFRHYRPYHLF